MNKRDFLIRKHIDEDTKRVITSHLATMNKEYINDWAHTVLDLIVVKNVNFPDNVEIHDVLESFFNATYYDTDIEIANSTPKAHVKAFNEYFRKNYQNSVRHSIVPDRVEPDFDLLTGDGCTIERGTFTSENRIYEEAMFSISDFMIGCETLYFKEMKDKTFKSKRPDIADAYNKCYRLYKSSTGEDWKMFSDAKPSYITVQL